MTLTQSLDLAAAASATGLDVLMLTEYGSRAYGTATASSDRDLLGVYVEHDRQVYGLATAETQNFRVHPGGRLERLLTNKSSRSAADVAEMHFHPLRKFVSLAAAGNPTVLSTLWSTNELLVVDTLPGALLCEHRAHFLSKHAGFRHAGYARAQRDALTGVSNKRTNRPELVSEHGYDTKYGSQIIRLLLAGLDLIRERTYHLPMKPEQVELIQEIRRGEMPLDDLLTLSEKLEHDLTSETEDCDLPDSVDYDVLNDLLRTIRNEHLGR